MSSDKKTRPQGKPEGDGDCRNKHYVRKNRRRGLGWPLLQAYANPHAFGVGDFILHETFCQVKE